MKVCKYECILGHNSYNNANFMKTIRHITHVDVLYPLTLILILKSIRRLSLTEESSIEQTHAKSLSV